jgi:hypothetical protein
MSSVDYGSNSVDKRKVVKLVREIAAKYRANISFTQHALDALKDDGLTTVDAINVICSQTSGSLRDGEPKEGSIRYQYGTSKIVLVICFWPNGLGLKVITAWRK